MKCFNCGFEIEGGINEIRKFTDRSTNKVICPDCGEQITGEFEFKNNEIIVCDKKGSEMCFGIFGRDEWFVRSYSGSTSWHKNLKSVFEELKLRKLNTSKLSTIEDLIKKEEKINKELEKLVDRIDANKEFDKIIKYFKDRHDVNIEKTKKMRNKK